MFLKHNQKQNSKSFSLSDVSCYLHSDTMSSDSQNNTTVNDMDEEIAKMLQENLEVLGFFDKSISRDQERFEKYKVREKYLVDVVG